MPDCDNCYTAGPDQDSTLGIVGLAAVASLCCIGLTAIAGGAAVAGGTTAGAMVAGGAIRSIGGVLVTALTTALSLVIIGLVLRRRVHQ